MRLLLLSLPVCAALVAGCSGSDARPVQVGTVERATVAEVVEAPGTVVARATAAVTSPADGTIAAVSVKEGAQVRAGEVLLRLSSPSAQAQLSRALAASAAGGGGGATGQALAAATLQSAQQTVDALTVRAPIAGTVTLGGGAPTGSDAVDGLLSQVPQALQGAAAGVLGGGGAQSSTTTTNDLSPGAPVGTGTPLLTVTDLSALGLTAEVDETDVLLVRPGTPAQVDLDAVPGQQYSGKVAGVDLAPTTSARGGVSYRVRLSLVVPAGAPAPRPGMSAVVRLQVREAPAALSVPSAAVVRDGDDDVVFLVRDGRAVRRVVQLGAQGDERVELTRGVQEGDRVVTRDADTLSDGDEIAR